MKVNRLRKPVRFDFFFKKVFILAQKISSEKKKITWPNPCLILHRVPQHQCFPPMVCAPCWGWCRVGGMRAGGTLGSLDSAEALCPTGHCTVPQSTSGCHGDPEQIKQIPKSECWSGMQTSLRFANCHKGGQRTVVKYLPAQKITSIKELFNLVQDP